MTTDVASADLPAATGPTGPVAAGGSGPSPDRPRVSRVAALGHRPLWLMWPTVVLLVLVIVLPFLLGIWISATDLDQYSLRTFLQAPVIGLSNYVEALQTSGLLHSIWVSFAFAMLTTLVCAPIGVLAALALNTAFRGRGLVRSAFLIPYVLPSFVTATVWRFILRPDGAFNEVLAWVGVDGGQWLIGDKAFWALVLVDIWAAWPFVYMMAMAGLQAIPDELYESADMDGASWWQKVRYVALPQIRGQLLLGLLLSTLAHFNNFTLPFVLFGTPAPDSVLTLPVNIYQTSFQTFRFGLGSAMSVLSLVLMLIPAVIYLRASRLTAATD